MSSFNVDREINNSIRSQWRKIDRDSREAIGRIEAMHAIGTGVCGCGKDVDTHTWLDEHTPIEQYIDKGLV